MWGRTHRPVVALQEEAERQRTVLTLTADLQNESHDMRRRGVGVVSRAPLAVSIGRPAPLAGSARANDRRSSARCQRTGTSGLRFESPARSRGSRAAAPAAFQVPQRASEPRCRLHLPRRNGGRDHREPLSALHEPERALADENRTVPMEVPERGILGVRTTRVFRDCAGRRGLIRSQRRHASLGL